MSNEIAENNTDTAQVTPAPATTEAPKAPVTAVETKPTVSPVEEAEKRRTAAFIKMRQEKQELKRQLAELKAAPTPTPAVAPVVTEQVQTVTHTPPPAPAPQAAQVTEDEGRKAIEALGADKEVSAIPGALMDILDMLDNDPRLTRLYNIDPTLALREAKGIYMSKAAISAPPPVPMPATPVSGVGSGNVSLEAMMAEVDKLKPGSKEFAMLANKINSEMKRLGI